MNPDLQTKLIESITKTEGFVENQLPRFVEAYIEYYAFSYLVGIIVCSIICIMAIIGAVFIMRAGGDGEDIAIEIFCSVTITLVPIVILLGMIVHYIKYTCYPEAVMLELMRDLIH